MHSFKLEVKLFQFMWNTLSTNNVPDGKYTDSIFSKMHKYHL